MRRRAVIASLAGGLTTSLAGCTGTSVVQEIRDVERLEPLSGEVWRINRVDGSAGLKYTVKSEDYAFHVFYFTERRNADIYQSAIVGESVDEQPTGHPDLRMTAVPDDNGIFTAKRPPDGSRMSIDIDDHHYLVVDYSNYAQSLNIDEYSQDIQVTVNVEVVETGSFL